MTLTWTFRDGSTTTDVLEWARKYEDDDYRTVAYDNVGALRLSTIWQGMPAVFGPNTYESAILSGHQLLWQVRYDTEEEAVAGHARLLKRLNAGWLYPEESS
jgi:hypothetical protein